MQFNPHIEAMLQGMGVMPQQQENTQQKQQMPNVGGFTSSGAYQQGQQAPQAQTGGSSDPLMQKDGFLNGGLAGLIGSFF